MKKLRWAMDGDFWEQDVSTPATMEGVARPVPGGLLPLGLPRDTKLSRPKQIDFMQRFMATPFLLSYSPSSAFTLHRVLTLPFSENWFASLLGQFNLQKFISSVKENGLLQKPKSAWLRGLKAILRDKSLYALGLSSELLLTPDDTLFLSSDSYGHDDSSRKKAVYHHNFPSYNLTMEAAWPGLFVDETGNYWDVPLSVQADFASLPSNSGPSYHLCLHHNEGLPKHLNCDQQAQIPATLLPGTSVKGAFSYTTNIDLWRSKAQRLRKVQPFDLFLSNPHVSAAGIISSDATLLFSLLHSLSSDHGAVVNASFGEKSIATRVESNYEGLKGFSLRVPSLKSGVLADMFASVLFTAQHGSFQRRFMDLTRFHARLDFHSGSQFLSGATSVVQDLLNSEQPAIDSIKAICPKATMSFQQQIAGPFSVRVDSGIALDRKQKDLRFNTTETVFALEYSLQVLGSAKAVAWYSSRSQEFMIEL